MRYRHKSQHTEKFIFWSWFVGTMIELGHLSWTLLSPAHHNVSTSWAWRKRTTTFKAMEQSKHARIEVLHGGAQSWLASKRGKSCLTPAAPTLHCPVGRDELPEQSEWLWETEQLSDSLQNSANQLMVLRALLKIANRLQLFTPHRVLGVSCLLWKPLQSKPLGPILSA